MPVTYDMPRAAMDRRPTGVTDRYHPMRRTG